MQRFDPGHGWDEAFVVFCPYSPLWYLKCLRGFRHCFAALVRGTRMVVINPMESRLEIIEADLYCDAEALLRSMAPGATVVRTRVRESAGYSFGIFSCVEVVKKVLGIKDWLIVTPSQLYRKLIER